MNNIPNHVKIYIIQYMNIETFVVYTSINKESQMLCKKYLKIKRLEFERNGNRKTIHNCLYKLDNRNIFPTERQIVKIKKVVQCTIEPENKKIYFWVISNMGIIYDKKKQKNTFCIYPDWCSIKNLEDDNFIPFY